MTAALDILCPFCSLPVELPPARWAADIDSCPNCDLEADLRPDPRVAANEFRLAAVMLRIKAQTLASVPLSLLSSRERWGVWDSARQARATVRALEAP